jgi:hypothetical protein
MSNTAASNVPDDTTIGDQEILWRRIPRAQMVSSSPLSMDTARPSSANFDDPELSVVLESECKGGIETLLKGHIGFGVVAFSVGEIRSLGWGVVRAPDDDLPGHAHVTCANKTQSQRRRLAKSCVVLVMPSD